MASKIRTVNPDKKKLVELCKQEIESKDYEISDFIIQPKRKRIHPPVGTVAIVVDIRDKKGAINIHENDSKDWVDGVGTEEVEEIKNLVIVIWDNKWYYYVVGTPRVAYITLKS